ncbi:MAG: apolipoprotein N-acyltransferase, partial [Chlorobi bacterium]|nr:apolipoprotein N-acyltransferase [Chlorobiota bacterium]
MNQLSRKYLVGLAVMSGLLLAASFPPVPTGITAFLGLVPFLFLVENMRSTWQAFRYSYLTFLVFNIFTIYWVTGYDMGRDPWLFAAGVAVILVHPLLFTIPGVLYYRVFRHLGQVVALATFPFIWTAYEWLAQLPSLSFPWLVLANSQTYDIDRIQFIQYTGAFGASFWIVGVNILVYVLIIKMGLKHWDFRNPKFYMVAAALVLSVLLPALHGRYVLNQKSYHATVNVGIIQPNIDPYEKWSSEPGARMKLLRTLLNAYESLGKRKDLDLVLLPETAIPFYILEQAYLPQKQLLQETVNRVGVPLLTGFPDIQYFTEDEAPPGARKLPGDSGLRYESYNSSMLVLPFSPQVQVYHKMKLTPMSERVPFIEIFPFLADALSWGVGISNWGVGKDTTVFTLPGKDYGR